GGYYTQQRTDGSYVDIVSQVSWYDTDYHSQVDASQHGFGVAASVEGGKPFAAYADWKIEPQLQMKLQYLNLDAFSDAISQVSGTSGSQGQIRSGLRVYRETPVWTPYLTLDAVVDVGKTMSVTVAGQSVSADFT
ncbi:autotransporter domain-containing protein, partial [Serratia marcescens]|uniref:autotransporter domain-containing protein n=1 Tax=Serratia marcescens TaxID=615 RepID=UPI0011E7D720